MTSEDYPLFQDIASLQEVVKLFNTLNFTDNRRDFLAFSRFKYEFIKLATSYELRDLTYLEKVLLTKNGIQCRYKNINVDKHENYSQEEMLLNKKEQLDVFAHWIVDAIELLYICLRYCEEMNSLLKLIQIKWDVCYVFLLEKNSKDCRRYLSFLV